MTRDQPATRPHPTARLAAVALSVAMAALFPGVVQAQEVEWVRQFETPFVDETRAVATDATGVYVVGLTLGALPGQTSAGSFDAFVRKYDADGSEVWTRQFGTVNFEEANGVWTDSTGVYVAGGTSGVLPGQASAGDSDIFVRKYDPDGNEVWTRQFGTLGFDTGFGITGDETGTYVAGTTSSALPGQTSAGSFDAFVRKYDAGGNELWSRQFGGASFDFARGAATDSTGVYVTGDAGTQTPVGSTDVFVRKFNSEGGALWSREFGSPPEDDAFGVTASADGIYVAGSTGGALPGQTSAGDSDAFLRAYSPGGDVLWTRQFGTEAPDRARGVAADARGVFVAGDTQGTLGDASLGFQDPFTRAYDADGSERWTTQFGSDITDAATGIALDATGVYVVGSLVGLTDAFVARIRLAVGTQFARFDTLAQIVLGPAASDDRFAIEARFTPGPGSDGIDPLTEPVTLALGTGEWTIPPGSFRRSSTGGYFFTGTVDQTRLLVAIHPLPGGGSGLLATASRADLAGTANPVPLSLTIGDDTGGAEVNAKFLGSGGH